MENSHSRMDRDGLLGVKSSLGSKIQLYKVWAVF